MSRRSPVMAAGPGSAVATGFAFALALSTAAVGQGTEVEFGSGTDNSGQPVEVTAESLSFDQDAGTALFRGEVLIVQGDMRMRGDEVNVRYGPDAGGETEIKRLEASGNVLFVSGGDAAESQSAVYTLEDGVVVMTGDVLLTRPDSAIAGDTLTVNVDDGNAVMEGRVRVVFTPEGSGEGGDGAGSDTGGGNGG